MSAPNTKDRLDVGSSWSLSTVVGLVAMVVVLVCGLLAWHHFQSKTGYDIRIATGPEKGIYDVVGKSVCHMLNQQEFVGFAMPLHSHGSADNMRKLVDGKADLAFVQSDQVIGKRVGLITPLYDELLHILVAKDASKNIQGLTDLKGLRVSIGDENSGTRVVVNRILKHLEIEIEKPLGLSTLEVMEGFRARTLDAAFLLTALPSPIVNELCDADLVRFHSLGDPAVDGGLADALSIVFPSYRKNVIPIRSYGSQPLDQPVSVISVSALLVASSDNVEQDMVRQITKALFEHRADLSTADESFAIAEYIREDYSPGDWLIPYHPGAVQYYRRDEPPFLVAYAEAISLLLTLTVGSFSASLAFRGWLRRRRKNRIDAYYNEVRGHSGDILAASVDDLRTYRTRLAEIRQRAFDDLVDERLDANESFSIFQDYLLSELMAIETRLNKQEPTSERLPP